MEQQKESIIDVSPATSLAVFKPVSAIVDANRPVIIDKSKRAIAALSMIKSIATPEEDEIANKILVKCGKTVTEMERLRKEYTGKVNAWLDEQIIPENDLKKEMDRVKKLRNARANELAALAAAESARIEKQRIYKVHESEVKNKMKASIESGIARQVASFEEAIAKMFGMMTLNNYADIEKRMAITPKMKEEFFNNLFNVDYDKSVMSAENFADLVTRAKGHFVYDNVNALYVGTANEILSKWKSQIKPRVAELQKIANGDALVARQAAERQRAEEEERKTKNAAELKSIEDNARATTQEEIIDTEFQAQIETQDIKELSGVRKKVYLRLSPEVEKDMLKVSNILAKAIIHVLSNPDTKGIFQRDAQGFPKRNEKGDSLYVDGIQYWLTQLEKVGYGGMMETLITGIIATQEVTTIAKAK